MNRFKKMRFISLLVALTMAFGLIPLASPQVASATAIPPSIQTQLNAASYWLTMQDSVGSGQVNAANTAFGSLTAAGLKGVLWPGGSTYLPINAVLIARFGSEDAAKSAIAQLLLDLEAEKYSLGTAAGIGLNILTDDKDTVAKLLPGITITDFSIFLATAQTEGLIDALGGNWKDILKQPVNTASVKTIIVNTLTDALTKAASSTIQTDLNKIGWNISDLANAEILVDKQADPSFAAEVAILKAFIRSQTVASVSTATPVNPVQSFSLAVGGTQSFQIKVFGNDVTADLTPASSSDAVATFTKAGGQFTIKGVSAGTADITASAAGADWVYKAKVTVSSSSSGGGGGGGPAVVNSTTGSATIDPSAGGSVSLGGNPKITIPAGALSGTAGVDVVVQQASNPPGATSGFRLLGYVYDFTIGGQEHYTFNKPVTLTFSFDPAALSPGETPVLEYYDTATRQWVSLAGTVSGNNITVTVDHFTQFGVFVKEVAPPPVPVQVFSDVPASYWASDAINQLNSLGYISGYPDGTFGPDNKITRAEFVSIISRALKLPAYSPAAPDFKDVAPGDWFYGSVEAVVYAGLVKGSGAGDFQPSALLTREQLATILVNALGKADQAELKAKDATSFTDDSSIAAWARGFVVVAGQDGLIKGYPDGSFAPQRNATRAEASVLISKTLALLSKKS